MSLRFFSHRLFATRLGRPCATLVLSLALFGGGCGSSRLVQLAEEGDLKGLRAEIDRAGKAGELDMGDVTDVAEATVERAIAQAKGKDGESVVGSLGLCAKSVDSALSDREEEKDGVAAEIALLRLEQDLASPSDYEDYATSEDPAWRAVGARALVDESDFGRRRELMVDGDQRVRLAAFRAAVDAPSPADEKTLLDAITRDPYPLARSIATRALGEIGSERAVLALRDAWARGDDHDRQAIAGAWGRPSMLDHGGRDQLLWAAQAGSGSASIAAAAELARGDGAGRDEGIGVLARAIREGTRNERVYAIGAAPDHAHVQRALNEAIKDPDVVVAVAALRRVATSGDGDRRQKAIDALYEHAKDKGLYKRQRGVSLDARAALASFDEPRAVPLILPLLADKAGLIRGRAGRTLLQIDRGPNAAGLLSDDEADVRTGFACSVLRYDEVH